MSLRRHNSGMALWKAAHEDEVRLQATAEDCQRWCRRGAASHSKHGQRRPGKLNRRWLTAAYGRQSAMATRRIVDDVERHSPRAGGVHRQGTKVLPNSRSVVGPGRSTLDSNRCTGYPSTSTDIQNSPSYLSDLLQFP